jgi:ABC-2 type transport system ATP-binding protein
MWEQIRQLSASGKTVLLTTHYLEEADALADRILVLSEGKVLTEGTPEQIKAQLGRSTIRCQTSLAPSLLMTFDSVQSVHPEGAVTVIAAGDPDTVVRQLLQHDPRLVGLEVTSVALEDAFVALTSGTGPEHRP